MNRKQSSTLSAVILALTLIFPLAVSAAIYEIVPTADSFVNSLYPNTNYGTDERLYAHFGSNSTKRTFLKFDLTGLPTGETITGASLFLHTDGGVQGLAVDSHYVANDTWKEDLLTWNNQPIYNTPAMNSTETVHGWMNWSIPMETLTADTNGLLSVLIKLQDESGDSATATFYSREAVIKPAELPYLSVSTARSVPIPATMFLFGIGLAVFVGVRRNIHE